MADVESHPAEIISSETRPSASERETAVTLHAGTGSRQVSKGSGITWWEACGGWNARYALSM